MAERRMMLDSHGEADIYMESYDMYFVLGRPIERIENELQ